jgi:DNA helicase-2/ATP-dependent DNA helicase PcrA
MTAPDSPRFIPDAIAPTDEQLAIQQARSRISIVRANAGAAKTTTLALRIGEALARKLEPIHILALTFTPEARDVLKTRLRDIGIPHATVAQLRIVTFEEFAAASLLTFSPRPVPTLAHIKDLKYYRDAALQIVADNHADVEDLVIDNSTLALSQFFHTQLELKAKLRLQVDVEGLSDDEVAEAVGVPYSTWLAIQEYEAIRLGRDNDTLFRSEFDATYDLACLLDADPSLVSLLPRYRIILCDELHDLNEAAFHLLQHIIAPNYSYFIGAGDSDQVIHSRLGASETFMLSRFGAQYPGQVTAYPLTYTFRHGPRLAYATAAFKNKPVDSLLTVRTDVQQRHYDATTTCADQVVASLQGWKKSGQALSACAILVREPFHSIAIENALMAAGIHYTTLDMPRYLEREEILFLRGMIAIALGNFAATDKSRRGPIFDALVTFAEVSFGQDENIGVLRQAVIDEPDALQWLFATREDQRSAQEVCAKVKAMVDHLRTASTTMAADLALGEMRRELASLLDFVQGEAPHANDPTLTRALHEAERGAASIMEYLQDNILAMDPALLLRRLRDRLLTVMTGLDQIAAGDVKQRMAKVVTYMRNLDPDMPAGAALEEICKLIRLEDLARRLYVHPHEARVVTKSVAGFIAAAEQMGCGLRAFSEWIAGADKDTSGRKGKHCVQLECVRNAKGMEFEHVILPYLAQGDFPFEKADPREEDNLFYVAITRAVSALTLISPTNATRRSSFIGRMNLNGTQAQAEAAVTRNGQQAHVAPRVEFKASGDEWAEAKALGAHWDHTRKIFYLKAGEDRAPFARWIGRDKY